MRDIGFAWSLHTPTHRLLVQTIWELRVGKGDPKAAMGKRSRGKRVKKEI